MARNGFPGSMGSPIPSAAMEAGQTSSETGPRADRERKLAELKALGVDPYPADSHRTHLTQEVRDRYGELEGTSATIAGRLMARRGHGKLLFLDVQDKAGKLQALVDSSILGPLDPPAAPSASRTSTGSSTGVTWSRSPARSPPAAGARSRSWPPGCGCWPRPSSPCPMPGTA